MEAEKKVTNFKQGCFGLALILAAFMAMTVAAYAAFGLAAGLAAIGVFLLMIGIVLTWAAV